MVTIRPGATGKNKKGERKMKTEKRIMSEAQKESVREMTSQEILDFQLRLQVACGLTHQESADYIAQAFSEANCGISN